MPKRESQFGNSGNRGETIREQYGPDWYRDVAEPMVCAYLERHFPSFERVFWASEIPEGDRLDRKGVDGVIVLKDENGELAGRLGIQISAASLNEEHGREVWKEKFRMWQRNPVYMINGEAVRIGAKEGDPLPIVFVRMNREDLENAWEATPHGDWRGDQSGEKARVASEKLPKNPRFQKDILDAMWLSFEVLTRLRPELAGMLREHRDVLSHERDRVLHAAEKKS